MTQDAHLTTQISIFANFPPVPAPPSVLQKSQKGMVKEDLTSSSGRIYGHGENVLLVSLFYKRTIPAGRFKELKEPETSASVI